MKDAERAEGTFAAHLRHASVFLEQTRVMEAKYTGKGKNRSFECVSLSL